MGCRSLFVIFERFSTALEWATKQTHVLDDYLLLAKSTQSCENLLSWFIAPEKTVGLETELPFVRITLDSIRMEA